VKLVTRDGELRSSLIERLERFIQEARAILGLALGTRA
jgi:hypothetical protein